MPEDLGIPLLSVKNVGYIYGSFHALTNITFDIDEGQLVALVGRNGAGKSTLLKCIAGWQHAPPMGKCLSSANL